jgi:hypothetical protein
LHQLSKTCGIDGIPNDASGTFEEGHWCTLPFI